MTTATKITVGRMFLVPVFVVLAVYYGHSVREGAAVEAYRWWALAVFIIAAASDGIDGWVARRFNQRSRLGAILDPVADKLLLVTAIITLSLVDWGPDGWRLPLWFTGLVVFRDTLIVGGIAFLHFSHYHIEVAPHWTGKVCTVVLMATVGWVMLKIIPFSPIYPSVVAAVFIVWSTLIYIREGLRILRTGDTVG